MAVFDSTDSMYDTLGSLFRTLLDDPSFGPVFKKENLVICFHVDAPDGKIWITPEGVVCGDSDHAANIEMWLSGDTCHRFWQKKVNLPVALAKGLIRAKGPMPKIMKLLPMLKPAYELYPSIASSKGLPLE